MRKAILTAILVSAIAFTGATMAEAKGDCKKCKSKCKVSKIKEEVKMIWIHKDVLKLTDEQLGQLKDIKHAAMKDLIMADAAVKVAKVDAKSAMWADKINLSEVNKLVKAKYGAKEKVALRYVKAVSDIQNVLTDEQNKQVKDIKTKMYLMKDCPYGGNCPLKSDCGKCSKKGKEGFCPLTGKKLDSAKGSAK